MKKNNRITQTNNDGLPRILSYYRRYQLLDQKTRKQDAKYFSNPLLISKNKQKKYAITSPNFLANS